MNSETDFTESRRQMVQRQLKARSITNERVLEAMGRVPREKFVRQSDRNRAYADMALPIQEGQTISQPYIVALMTQQLQVERGQKVLEIGTGSGYQTAVLAQMGAEIYTVEFYEKLSTLARRRLEDLGYEDRVDFKVGDGSEGWEEKAPFERAIITAAVPEVPAAVKNQLQPGGLVVAPVGSRYSQRLCSLRKKEDGSFREEELISCRFVPLQGRGGWNKN